MTRGFSEITKELIAYAYLLLQADHPQTLRQLHYAIFSRKEIQYENDKSSYRRLGAATTAARRRYRQWELAGAEPPFPDCAIPPEWMVDESRQPESVSLWDDAQAFIEAVKRAYRRDNWQTQKNHCEVWCEKGTIMSSLRPVKDNFGVTLRVCHGFGSTGMEAQIGQLYASVKKEITVFYLGDQDPSGHVIERDLHRRIEASSGREFDMWRLAIHPTDIDQFNLPPQRIKNTDSRAHSFRHEFGDNAATVELDALPAAEPRRRVEESVSSLIDCELWNRQLTVE
jgi:hypothetical protein